MSIEKNVILPGHPDLVPGARPSRRPHTHRLTLLVVLACLALPVLIAGCSATRSGSAGAAAGSTKSAHVLRYPMTTEPTDLDPALVQDGDTIDLLQNVFEGLVTWDEHSQIAPNLAEKWDISPDGKTYTFHLKQGSKFHNGREVTAADFKYSLDRACDPATKSQTVADYLNDIVGAMDCIQGKAKGVSGVTVVDPYTLQISIDAPKSYWLGKMTYPTGYVVCKEAIDQNGGVFNEKSLIGTGPFRLASPSDFQRGYQVAISAFDGYHRGRPRLDRIERPILKDASTRLSKYEAGELDMVTITPSDLDHIDSDPKLKPDLHSFPRAATWYLALNQAAPDSPFGDKRVRQAFNLAVDKAEIVRIALKGIESQANSIVPPGMGRYVSTCKPLPYDPVRAKGLLAMAGYGPGGKPFPALTLTFRDGKPEVAAVAQVAAQQLKTNLGITVQLQSMEWGQFLKERNRKSMPFSHLRWGADYLDPQDYLSVLLHTSKVVNGQEDHPENGVGYSNPDFDRLCDQADVERDPSKRNLLYQQAEQIAIDDAPWVPIYYQKDLELDKPAVQNLRDSLLGHLPHLTTTVTR